MQNLIRSLIIIVVVGAVGFGLYVGGVFKPDLTAPELLAVALEKSSEITSARYIADISATNFNAGTGGMHIDNFFTFHLDGVRNYPGTVDGFQAQYAVSLSGTPRPDFPFAMDGNVRFIGKDLYFQMSNAEAPNMPEEVELVKNMWFSMNLVELVEKYGDEQLQMAMKEAFGPDAEKKGAEEKEKLTAIYKAHPFAINPSYAGIGKVGDADVRLISFEINKNVLADFIVAYQGHLREKAGLTSLEDSADVVTSTDVMVILNDITFKELIFKIGTRDHHFRGMSAKMYIAVAEDGSTGDVAFTVDIPELNQPVSVTAPDSFMPIDSLLELSFTGPQ